MPRKEREIELGEKAKRFTNVYVKNFNEAMTEEDLSKMFEKFGKITSLKVNIIYAMCEVRVPGYPPLQIHLNFFFNNLPMQYRSVLFRFKA